jgi:hypothetical protein
MRRVVEADENGSIRLAREWTGATPHALYIVESEGEKLHLRPATGASGESVWQTMTPEQRVEDFRRWLARQQPSDVHLTNEQLRRENMYD